MTVGVENGRALAEHLFQPIGVALRLGAARFGIDGGFLPLDHAERLAIVAPKDVIALTLAAGRRLVQNLDLLADLLGTGAIGPDLPTCRDEQAVDQPASSRLLVESEGV